MPVTATPITIGELKANWSNYSKTIKASHPFILSEWLEAWWGIFGGGDELRILHVARGAEVIGIAPLMMKAGVAKFIGSADVCDYLDFPIRTGAETDFYNAVLDSLKSSGVTNMDLESLRPDSTVMTHLIPLARSRGMRIEVSDTDVTLEMPLPGSWEEYLGSLTTHQRHEIGRKGRRLTEAGEVVFDIKRSEDIGADLAILIRLLRISRADKAEFMTEKMEAFFKRIAGAMDAAGLLRFGHLRIGGRVVASIMCFDYNGTRYLYNSGYDPEYSALSAGLLSKVYSIKDAIEHNLKKYDYLKGAEVYKYHLGGIELPISCAAIELNS